jgi:replicative DNA helicase
MPHDPAIERAVIGACILNSAMVRVTSGMIDPSKFFISDHEKFYAVLVDMDAANQPIDILTFGREVAKRKLIKRDTIASTIADLTTGVPYESEGFVAEYCRLIVESWAKRQAALFAEDLQYGALNGSGLEELESKLREHAESLGKLRRDDGTVDSKMLYDELAGPYMQAWQEGRPLRSGFGTGLERLDRMTGGFGPGEYIVLAGNTSRGKSALCSQILVHTAAAGHPVLYFSLEMQRESLFLRMACQQSRVCFTDALQGSLSQENQSKLMLGMEQVGAMPIKIDDTPGIDIGQMRAIVTRDMRRRGTKMVGFDYIQIATAEGENRQQEVSRISGTLQHCARDLGRETGGFLVGISQLSRGDYQHPELRHLRDSGSLEQDADIVIFVSDEGERTNDDAQMKRIQIGKQRNGPCHRFPAVFIGPYMRFENAAEGSEVVDDDDGNDSQPSYGRRKKRGT